MSAPAHDAAALERALGRARDRLMAARGDDFRWVGALSPSALATAVAVSALCAADRDSHAERIARGVEWLRATRNPDGGWGDTPESPGNISTTWLVRAALRLSAGNAAGAAEEFPPATREEVEALCRRYGADRTFSAPILSNLAAAGLVDWDECPQLPFWLAAVPRGLMGALGLQVVSYALPALISVGLARYRCGGRRSLAARLLGPPARGAVLRLLERITPESGGYLEAVPLTGFTVMNMIAADCRDHLSVTRGLEFLCSQQAADGSWRIERDLSIWLTTQSVAALGGGEAATRDFLLSQQTAEPHPFTGSPPGGWGWTDSSGSVPDADDTSGALLALALLPDRGSSLAAAARGLHWLTGLQNRDGGWPTFCRGWQRLPFDRSCAEITAHVLRAVAAWKDEVGDALGPRLEAACARGLRYLSATQRPDGSWVPLWFGSQSAPGEENPVYGTSRVLACYRDLGLVSGESGRRAAAYLISARNPDGSWGGAPGVPGSVEETALACEALLGAGETEAAAGGLAWLCRKIESGGMSDPSPIGLYFARLWYHEELYPVIFSVSALRRAVSGSSAPAESVPVPAGREE
ncbi:MAG: prenyltransferase/squalene oxidase repeat-containing protein [Planctomycetota bacterium]|jgi:squalene-hopene/tetraprenyl-beta-curcumene cyclase